MSSVELIEWFLSSSSRNFAQEWIPKHEAPDQSIHDDTFSMAFSNFLQKNDALKSSAKESMFFMWFFLGALGNLPNTGLMSKMGFRDMYIKCNLGMIRMAYHVESPNREIELMFRSIWMPGYRDSTTDPGLFTNEELKELVSLWDLDSMDDISSNSKYIEFTNEHSGDTNDAKYGFVHAHDYAVRSQGRLSNVIAEKVTNEVLNTPSNTNKRAFVKYTESKIGTIAMTNMDLDYLFRPDISQVEDKILSFMYSYYEPFHKIKETFNLPSDPQAYLGYISGMFVLNYQSKYQLSSSFERLVFDKSLIFAMMPQKKYAQLLQVNIPIIITPAYSDLPNNRLGRISEPGIREMLPSFVTDSKLGVLVASNYELPVERLPHLVTPVEINQGLLVKFFTIYKHYVNNGDMENGKKFLQKEFQQLCESIGTAKSSTLSAFLFGQTLSIKDAAKFFFHYQDRYLQEHITTFAIKYDEYLLTFNIGPDDMSQIAARNFLQKGQNNYINLPTPQSTKMTNVNIVPSTKEIIIDHFENDAIFKVHNGETDLILNIDPWAFYKLVLFRRGDMIRSSVANCIFNQRHLIKDATHLKNMFKGLFTTKFQIVSALEQYGPIVALVPQEFQVQPPMDFDQGSVRRLPPDGMIRDDKAVLIKLQEVINFPATTGSRLNMLDSIVLNFWTEYYTTLNFPGDRYQPTLATIVYNSKAREKAKFIEGAIWSLTDTMHDANLQKAVDLAKSCQHQRLKRAGIRCAVSLSDLEDVIKFKNEYNIDKDFEGQDIPKLSTDPEMPLNKDILDIDSEKLLKYVSSQNKQVAEETFNYLAEKKTDDAAITGKQKPNVLKLLKHSKSLMRLNKMSKVANLGTMGLIATDTISEVSNGNYGAAAFTVSFIMGNIALGMAPSVLFRQATKLGLRGYKFGSVALKSAAPFVGKLASAYILYDLVNNIKLLNSDQHDIAVAGIIADSAFLVIDVAEIAVSLAEAFGYIEGVSSIVGPVGAVIGALVFIGTDIYSAYKMVQNIEYILKLTPEEKFIEGLRAFVGMEPEQYIEKLIERKERFNQLAKYVFEFLNKNMQYKSYFLPLHRKTGKGHWQDEPNNCVDLTTQAPTTYLARDFPKVPKGSELLCFNMNGGMLDDTPMQVEFEKSGSLQISQRFKYLCEHFMGITNLKSQSNVTLINIGDGNDCANGFLKTPNVFLIGDGVKNIFGGFNEDIFILNGNKTLGNIFGKTGSNMLDLSHFALNNSKLVIKLSGIKNYIMFENKEQLFVGGITQIIGRKFLSDSIYPGCTTEYIDSGNQGFDTNIEKDLVYISAKICHYNMKIKVQNNVNIINKAMYGKFTYFIATNHNHSLIHLTHRSKADHQFIFNKSIDNIKHLQISRGKKGRQVLFIFQQHTVTVRCYLSNCSYYFQDSAHLIVERKNKTMHFHAYMHSKLQPLDVMNKYAPIAKKLGVSFTINCELEKATVFISESKWNFKGDYVHPWNNIMQNDPEHDTHMYASYGENVYVITTGNKKLDKVQDAFIEPVHIYEEPQCENFTRTLVLTNVHQKLENDLNYSLIVKVVQPRNKLNLLLELSAMTQMGKQISLTHIQFNGSVTYGLSDKLQIIINDIPYRAVYNKTTSNFNRDLRPMPYIALGNETQFVVLYTENVPYPYTEFYIDRNVRDLEFYHTENGSLILLEEDGSKILYERFYIILINFYKNRTSTLSTLKFSFQNKEIDLANVKQKIDTALSFESYVSVCNFQFQQILNSAINSGT